MPLHINYGGGGHLDWRMWQEVPVPLLRVYRFNIFLYLLTQALCWQQTLGVSMCWLKKGCVMSAQRSEPYSVLSFGPARDCYKYLEGEQGDGNFLSPPLSLLQKKSCHICAYIWLNTLKTKAINTQMLSLFYYVDCYLCLLVTYQLHVFTLWQKDQTTSFQLYISIMHCWELKMSRGSIHMPEMAEHFKSGLACPQRRRHQSLWDPVFS